MKAIVFDRVAGLCAVLAGLVGLCYSVSFVIIARSNSQLGAVLSALFLLLGGILSSLVMVALYRRLRESDPGFAGWALLVGTLAALGSALHGGYDLANALHPIPLVTAAGAASVPSQIDPRGLLTFGLAGIALFVFSWLIVRSQRLPRGLGYLGYLLGVLLIIVYLGRLIILAPSNPLVLGPAALTGFILNPLWYIWLGISLSRATTR